MNDMANVTIPTIVYVEDNAGDATLLEEEFRLRGYAVQLLVFDSGIKSLCYFQGKLESQDVPPPHRILLFSQFPDLTGAQLMRFIRGSKVYDGTPV